MLRDRLEDWTDFDIAEHTIGVCLGLMPDDMDWFRTKGKWVFWSANLLGHMLHEVLLTLVRGGVLERNEADECQFRYNRSFRSPWETPGEATD